MTKKKKDFSSKSPFFLLDNDVNPVYFQAGNLHICSDVTVQVCLLFFFDGNT